MSILTRTFIILFTISPFLVTGQNLVQNPGFENNTGLPVNGGQWLLATNWSNANSPTASPDYLHTNGSGIAQLPGSIFGTVNPFQGSAVMGMALWYSNSSNFREYISQNLAAPLVVGNSYTFSFYVSNGVPGSYGGSGTDNLQVDFSVNPFNQSNSLPFNYTPLLSTGTMIYSNTWIPISFTFVATSPYTHFAIGNFRNDANTLIQQFVSTPNPTAYYFIDEVSLTLNTSNSINITGNSQICLGDSTILQASNSTVYAWADSLNPNIIIDNDSVLAVTPNTTTTYYVYGNNDTASYTVNVVNPPIVNLGNDTALCQGQTLLLNTTSSNAIYLWQDNSSNPTYMVSQQGTYWVSVTVNNCSATDTLNVNYTSLPLINLGNDTVLCQGELFMLNATTANATYQWQDNSTNQTYTVSQQGAYWVNVTVNNCSATDTLNVNYNSLPLINLGSDTALCQGDTLILNATTANAAYQWQNNSTNQTYTVSQPGAYWVNVTVNNCSATDTLNVNYNSYPVINLGNDTVLCQGELFMLNATTANATYQWQDNSTNQTYIVSQEGPYWVNVTVNNCRSTDTLYIEIEECEVILEMPNVFTPNNDGINDYFHPIKVVGINQGILIIYNRWGQKIIETDNILTGWDGKFNGQDCTDGTYFWIVQCTTITNESKTLKGFLTLIK